LISPKTKFFIKKNVEEEIGLCISDSLRENLSMGMELKERLESEESKWQRR